MIKKEEWAVAAPAITLGILTLVIFIAGFWAVYN